MDAKTREALEGSIAKWQAIVDGTGYDRGISNCPLCKMFYENITINVDDFNTYCCGCPVSEKVGDDNCMETPYMRWDRLKGRDATADTPERKVAAQAELDFLISLRPKESK